MNTTPSYETSQEWVELFRMETGSNNNRLIFNYEYYFTYLTFGFLDGTGYNELRCPLNSTMQNSLSDGKMHHLIATYDAPSAYKAVWVDGVELCSTTTTGWNTGSNSTACIIGNRTVVAFLIAY
jgi:hypothetical protein